MIWLIIVVSCWPEDSLSHSGGLPVCTQNVADNVDEHVVKQAVLQAVRNCSESGSEQDEE